MPTWFLRIGYLRFCLVLGQNFAWWAEPELICQMGVVFCSYPSLEGGGPSSDQDQKWCLFKWYWHNFFSFSQYVQKDCRKNEKGTKDPNGIDTLLKMLLFVLIWPFQTSPFEVCPPFFFEGGGEEKLFTYITCPLWRWWASDTSAEECGFLCMFYIV